MRLQVSNPITVINKTLKVKTKIPRKMKLFTGCVLTTCASAVKVQRIGVIPVSNVLKRWLRNRVGPVDQTNLLKSVAASDKTNKVAPAPVSNAVVKTIDPKFSAARDKVASQ